MLGTIDMPVQKLEIKRPYRPFVAGRIFWPSNEELFGFVLGPTIVERKVVKDPKFPSIKGHMWILSRYGKNIDIACFDVWLSRKHGKWMHREVDRNQCAYGDMPRRWLPVLGRYRDIERTSMWFLNTRDDWQDLVAYSNARGWDRKESIQSFLLRRSVR